jgi:hypothetical protein
MANRSMTDRLRPKGPGDPDIWKIAAVLVAKFGRQAIAYADDRGGKALREGDRPTWQIWQWIGDAVAELLRVSPEEGETVH